MKVTAVLINYKRPADLERVKENLLQYEFIDEIIVWDNTRDNNFVYGRFLASRKAKNDVVYTQDDDCIIENIPEIFATFDGIHLSNGLKPEAIKSYSTRQETLLGWGSFFKKDWTYNLDRYVAKYGVDYYLYTNADRIFTSLLPKPFNTIEAKVVDFPSATDPSIAMSMQEDFINDRDVALERVQKL